MRWCAYAPQWSVWLLVTLDQYLPTVVEVCGRSEWGSVGLCCPGGIRSTVEARRSSYSGCTPKGEVTVTIQMCVLKGLSTWGLWSIIGSSFPSCPGGPSPSSSRSHSCPECKKQNTSYTAGLRLCAFLQKTVMPSALFHSSVTVMCWPGG